MERRGKGTYSSSSRIRGFGNEGYPLSDIGARGSCRLQSEDHPAEQAQGTQSPLAPSCGVGGYEETSYIYAFLQVKDTFVVADCGGGTVVG